MLYEVKIYGDISNEQGKGKCSLVDVQSQLQKANGQAVKVRIKSFGGDVDEGFAIYDELRRYAEYNKVKITTLAEAQCASIATVIFLAGDERIVSKHVEPFVHNAWVEMAGDAKQLMTVAEDLDRTNRRIAQHYADHTNLTYEEALTLMGNDTSLKPDECVKLRFATKIESVSKPVALKNALRKQETFKQEFNMDFKNRKERFNILNAVAKIVGIEVKPEIQNKIVFTADSKEIDFYELGEDEIVEAGAKATIDGAPAEGTYVVPDTESGESKRYVFEAGVLVEILEADAGSDEEMEALKEELSEAKAEIESLNSEAMQTAEVLNALNEKFKALERENVQLKAKMKATSKGFIDLKEKSNGKTDETKSKVSEAVAKFKESKFKTK